ANGGQPARGGGLPEHSPTGWRVEGGGWRGKTGGFLSSPSTPPPPPPTLHPLKRRGPCPPTQTPTTTRGFTFPSRQAFGRGEARRGADGGHGGRGPRLFP